MLCITGSAWNKLDIVGDFEFRQRNPSVLPNSHQRDLSYPDTENGFNWIIISHAVLSRQLNVTLGKQLDQLFWTIILNPPFVIIW
jgi:hypothetical protein